MVRALSWRFWISCVRSGSRRQLQAGRGEAEFVEGGQGDPEVLASPDLFAPEQAHPDRRADQEESEDGRRACDGDPVPTSPARRPRRGVRASGEDRSAAQEPAKIVGELSRGAIAVIDFLGHGGGEYRFQVSRNGRIEPPGGDWLLGDDLAEQLVAVVAVEGGVEGHQLVEGGPEAVDVGPGVELPPPFGLFWTQVPEGADNVAGLRQVASVHEVSEAEVGDPQVSRRFEQEVCRLDIAVDDPQAVGMGQGIRRLNGQARRLSR